MKIKIITILLVLFGFFAKAQTPSKEDSLKGFDMKEMQHHLEYFKGTPAEKKDRLAKSQRAYIDRKYQLGQYDIPKLVRDVNARYNAQSTTASCNNIGFDNGNTTGWTMGGNTSSNGSGAATSGDYAITSGAGLDPFGNFPVVFSGTNSLQLSNTNTSTTNFVSTATRVLTVTPGNTFFNLHFALDILDFPHDSLASAKFSIQFYNASGVVVPCPQFQCTYYEDAAGNPHSVGISGFQQTWGCGNFATCSPTTGPGVNLGSQNFPVTYAPWQTVGLDLTSYVGTNVTCVVTCAWCLYNYDWAYCYIDADCPTSNVPPLGQCLTLPASLCGPPGMTTYAWTAPAGNATATSATTCINATTAGVFTLNCSVSTSTCPPIAYTFTYAVGPGPTATYTNTTASCAGSINFTSTSITGGGPPITNYTWDWGDGTASGSGSSSTHNFASVGTQTVTLIVSNGSCLDSIKQTVNIPPHPIVSFTTASNCVNAVSNYTSTSTSAAGITSQTWNFGDGSTGTGVTPNHTYALAGTYSVTLIVSDASGCTDSVKSPITVYALPTITTNSPSACNGASATLIAGGGTTYTWSPATGLSTTTGATVTATPPATQTYIATGTDANGCVNTSTTTVLVVANPVITTNAPSMCVGTSTTVIANGCTTYTWSPATGLSATTGTSVVASPAATTVYTINGTVGTCTAVGTTTVTVLPLPTITASSGSICVTQQTATLTASGGSTYTWSPAIGLNSGTGTTVLATPSVTSVYAVTGTDLNGCINTGTTSVTVYPLPVVPASGSTVCVNGTINLNASGGVSYSWSGPNSFVANTPNVNIPNADVTMSGAYAVVVVNANNCVNGNVVQILVNPLPIVSANSPAICLGQNTATVTSTGAVNYWYAPTTGLSSSAGTSVVANPPASTTYTVTGIDANGCQGEGTFNVTVNPLPLVSVSPFTSSGCAPVCITFSNIASGAGTCAWDFGDGTTSTSCMPSHCFTGKGSYSTKLTLTDNNGCVNSSNASVIVYPVPVADFNADPQPVSILDPYVQFTNASTGAPIAIFNWSLGDPDSTKSNVANPSIMYPAIGTYTVVLIVTTSYGCADSTTKYIKVEDEFVMYVPNAFSPNNDGVNDMFFAKGDGFKDFKMTIFDRWGTQVFTTNDIAKGWDGHFHSNPVMEDVYVWKIECKTTKGESKMLKGHVSIIK